ncbi:hypothetical protein PNEG_02853 [Pneumocystis murina B123]|uniref:Translation initiation factor IF-3 n=1 Tax=Pneumocystis murina (strain B123) TaxID=1069680 RepID=M7NNH2_PNEMU|nr:hypothetical protein PNEG_02853 [Pneumocystis murina B123]EMR08676.1 hypothetical protein PNEG_02853 [Pneumocystis murina B123]
MYINLMSNCTRVLYIFYIKRYIFTFSKLLNIFTQNMIFKKNQHINTRKIDESIIIKDVFNYDESKCSLPYNNSLEKNKSIKKVKVKNCRNIVKVLQINWNIDEHDIKHRLRTATRSLEKGYNIDVIINSKKSGESFELSKREKMLKNLREKMLINGNERKPAIGTISGLYRLYFKPKNTL